MYTLYVKPGCPFCARVLQVVEQKQIPVEIKETTDDGVVEELIAHGGKKQVPYLVDSERGTAMYETDDIIAYLVTRMSGTADSSEMSEPTESTSGQDDNG